MIRFSASIKHGCKGRVKRPNSFGGSRAETLSHGWTAANTPQRYAQNANYRTLSPSCSLTHGSRNRWAAAHGNILPTSTVSSITQRTYIFLPSSFSDVKDLFLNKFPLAAEFVDSSSTYRTRLVLKLRERVAARKLPRTPTDLSPPKNKNNKPVSNSAKIGARFLRKKAQEKRRMGSRENVKKLWQTILARSDVSISNMIKRSRIGTKATSSLLTDVRTRNRNMKSRMKLSRQELQQRLRNKFKYQLNASFSRLQKQVNYTGGKGWRNKEIVIEEPSRKTWFDADGYPLTSRHWITKRFVNPWNSVSTDGQHSLFLLAKWRLMKLWKMLYSEKESSNMTRLLQSSISDSSPPKKIKESVRKEFFPSTNDQIRLTWVGHSTCLVSMHGFNILTDPIFSEQVGPLFGIGVERSVSPALSVDDLPSIDALLISHDHYDHLDYHSVLKLKESGKIQYWVVPLGIKRWLMEVCDVDAKEIVELEWWETAHFRKDHSNDSEHDDESSSQAMELVEIKSQTRIHPSLDESTSLDHNEKTMLALTCAPAQHWCSRSPFDRNKRLWCSFAVKTTRNISSDGDSDDRISLFSTGSSSLNFYFGGDTGLPPAFPLHRQIGDKLGPFDLAALPVGAYEPEFFMKDSHCNPQEAVQIHKDIRCRKSVGIHWGTFPLANEGLNEPAEVLKEIVTDSNVSSSHGNKDITSVDGIGGSKDTGHSRNETVDFSVVNHGEWIESADNAAPVMDEEDIVGFLQSVRDVHGNDTYTTNILYEEMA